MYAVYLSVFVLCHWMGHQRGKKLVVQLFQVNGDS